MNMRMKQRMLSGLTALLMTASLSGYTASAEEQQDAHIAIEIDRITLTMDELAALEYTVPIYVRLTENSGFNAAEFGVQIDERCILGKDIKWLDYDDGYAAASDSMVWRTLAGSDDWCGPGTLLKLNLTLPEDAAVGDVYTISYCEQAYRAHVWSSASGGDLTADGAVAWTDGAIEIIETPDETAFTVGRDTWSFRNDTAAFGEGLYCIRSNYYRKLVKQLSDREREQVDSLLLDAWGGSCYGMAVTTLLADGDVMTPSQWQVGAHTLHDLSSPPSEEIQSLINYYHALQKTEKIQQMLASAVYLQSEEEKLRSLMECLADHSPTLLTYVDFDWGGHAVVAYDILSGAYTWDGTVYDSKVLLYDSNIGGVSDDCCLYFDSDTWEWTIPAYDLSSDKSFLGIISDDILLLNYRGYLDGSEYVTPDPYISILTASAAPEEYTISKAGNVSSGVRRTRASAGGSGIKAYAPLSGSDAAHEVCFALPDADSGYVMELKTPDALELSMDYEDCLLKLDADAAVKAAFDPAGKISLEGEQTSYTMKVICDEELGAQIGYLQIEGQDVSGADIQRTEEGCLLRASNLTRVSVRTRDGENEEVLGFSVQSDSVLLHRMQDGVLAASVDTDGDGVYETVIARSTEMLAGDLTLDGTLTMTDVIALEQNLHCGTPLNTIQFRLADYNRDTLPDAADTTAMLRHMLQAE